MLFYNFILMNVFSRHFHFCIYVVEAERQIGRNKVKIGFSAYFTSIIRWDLPNLKVYWILLQRNVDFLSPNCERVYLMFQGKSIVWHKSTWIWRASTKNVNIATFAFDVNAENKEWCTSNYERGERLRKTFFHFTGSC